MELTDLDLTLRLGLFFLAHFPLALWMLRVVAPAEPGSSRLVRCLPLIPLLWFMSCLFRTDSPGEFTVAHYCLFNFLWLTPSKIWSFCFNRGQLMKGYESGSTCAFVIGVLFAVDVAFDEIPIAKGKDLGSNGKRVFRDVQFSVVQFSGAAYYLELAKTICRAAVWMCIMVLMEFGYRQSAAHQMFFWRDVCLGWFVYGYITLVYDVQCFMTLAICNIKLNPSFDRPWISQSFREFWRRWNRVIGQILRQTVYDPITQGTLIAGPLYFERSNSSRMRKTIALLVTFVVSSVFHVFVLMYILSMDSALLYGSSFLAFALVVLLEDAIKYQLKKRQLYTKLPSGIPSVLYILYTHAVIHTLAHLLFWPDLHRCGFIEAALNGALPFKLSW